MSDSVWSSSDDGVVATSNAWDRFWFQSESVGAIAALRGMLCVIACVYFLSASTDAEFWYAGGQPFGPEQTATFWSVAGLESDASWSLSPLFLSGSIWVYRLYLVLGGVMCIAVFTGRGGRAACWILWLLIVGWGNRAMILSGLTETLLSLGLFAAAIAPPAAAMSFRQPDLPKHWSARLARQLLAVQITVIGLVTLGTMLGGRVWFNGIGAYALAAPYQDRTINWTNEGSLLISPMVHETLTHLLVLALPVGLVLAWGKTTNRFGLALLIAWCIVIALLGSLWLYAATFAVMVLAIKRD